MKARAPAAPEPRRDGAAATQDCSSASSPILKLTRSSVQIDPQAAAQDGQRGRRLPARAGGAADRTNVQRALRRARRGGRREVPRRRRRRRLAEQDRRQRSRFSASVQDGKIEDGLGALAVEAKRVREFGFAALGARPRQEVARRVHTSAPTPSATRPRAARSRRNTSATSSTDEPAPASPTSTQLVQAAAAGDHRSRRSRRCARTLLTDDSRVVLADVAAESRASRVPTEAELQKRRSTAAETVGGHAVDRHDARRGALVAQQARAGRRRLAARRSRTRRDHRSIRQRRRGLAEADRLQERSGALHAGGARAGVSLAPRRTIRKRRWRRRYVGLSGVGGIKALDLAEAARRQDRVRVAVRSRCRRTASSGSGRAGRSRDRAAAALPGIHARRATIPRRSR